MSVARLAPVIATIALLGLAHCVPHNPTVPTSPAMLAESGMVAES